MAAAIAMMPSDVKAPWPSTSMPHSSLADRSRCDSDLQTAMAGAKAIAPCIRILLAWRSSCDQLEVEKNKSWSETKWRSRGQVHR